MCAPALLIAATVASAAISAYGQHQQGQSQKAAANYNAKLDEYNASLQERQAADAVDRGGFEAGRYLQGVNRDIGQARVQFAGSGVDLSVGSPTFWESDALLAGFEDAAMIEYNAAQEARQFSAGAYNSRASAALRRSQGRNAATAGNLQAAGSLLAGASAVSGMVPGSTARTTGRGAYTGAFAGGLV